MLLNIGYSEIFEADTQDEALKLTKQHLPSLVFMDVVLKGEDGIAVTRMIMGDYPSTKVVVMTGAGTPSTAIRSLQAGAVNFLLKPFGIDQFNAVVRKALHVH